MEENITRKEKWMICPKCGSFMHHEKTHGGAFRHSCENSKCNHEIYGVVTDGSCLPCAVYINNRNK